MTKKTGCSIFQRGCRLALLVILGILVLTLAAGCSSSPAPATTATTAPTPSAPATTAAPEVINLKLSSPYFEVMAPSVYAAHFSDLVEQKTNGQVKIERYYGGTLGTLEEHLQLVSTGAVDLISLHVGSNEQKMPLHNAIPQNVGLSREILMAVVNDFRNSAEVKPILEAEQKQNNIKIFDYNVGGISGIMSKSEISSMNDLTDKKINVLGSFAINVWKELGWIPVNLELPEIYDGLSRGVIDAGFGPISATLAMKWADVAKYYLNLNVQVADIPVAINLQKFESLPPDVQQAFLEAGKETSAWSIEQDAKTIGGAFAMFEKAGCSVILATAEETKLFTDVFQKHRNEDWLQICEKAGVSDKAEVLDKIWKEMYAAALAGQ